MTAKKAARIAGLFIAGGILQIAGVLLIQSGPSPLGWREVAGVAAIGGAWQYYIAAGSAIVDSWTGRKGSP